MGNLKKLDLQYRLTPWSLQEHADYVAGRYGSYMGLGEEANAEKYVARYLEKEAESDKAYEQQREYLRRAPVLLGSSPQELPDPVKIEWDPRKRFAKVVVEEKAPEAPKKGKKAKKD